MLNIILNNNKKLLRFSTHLSVLPFGIVVEPSKTKFCLSLAADCHIHKDCYTLVLYASRVSSS